MRRIVSKITAAGFEQIEPSTGAQQAALSEMLAEQTAPRIMTDSIFLLGHQGERFTDTTPMGRKVRDFYYNAAKRAGVNPHGKRYSSQLASYPGDPKAWFDSRADWVRVCEEKGLNAEGGVTVRAADRVEVKDDEPYRVAESIVEREFEQQLKYDPDLARAKPERKAEAKHNLRTRLSGAQD